MLVRERRWHDKVFHAAISPLTASFLGLAFLAVTFSAVSPEARGSEPLQQAATPQETTQDSQQAKPADAENSEIAVPLPKGEKLILTDGSFQMVREYQREGDRVRYFSLERSAWEEIPANLVDWAATEKVKAEREITTKAAGRADRENGKCPALCRSQRGHEFRGAPERLSSGRRRILCRRWKERYRCAAGGSHSAPGQRTSI